MNYGHFDELNKEYVITRPDTPSAWANYLGDPEYGAIISNNAGGYSFVKSGANGRVIRYRFNGVGTDTPGRYVYLRDLQRLLVRFLGARMQAPRSVQERVPPRYRLHRYHFRVQGR